MIRKQQIAAISAGTHMEVLLPYYDTMGQRQTNAGMEVKSGERQIGHDCGKAPNNKRTNNLVKPHKSHNASSDANDVIFVIM